MIEVPRLRMLLCAVVLAAPLACSGGAHATRATEGAPAAAPRAAQVAPDAGLPADGRTGVLRTPPTNCTSGQWCGPAARVTPFAGDGVETRQGCPVAAIDADGTSFTWREQDTASARAAGDVDACCYDFSARCSDEMGND